MILLQVNFYESMETYLQKLWERRYELIQMRIKIAYLCNFYDFSQSTLDKMVAKVTSEVQNNIFIFF